MTDLTQSQNKPIEDVEELREITVAIPTPLRSFTEQKKHVPLQAASVSDALARLTVAFPGLKAHLFDENGALRSFVNIYLNSDDVRYLGVSEQILKPGDLLRIVPSIAGGS